MSKTVHIQNAGTGLSINRELEHTVGLKQVVSDGNFVGINMKSGDSGDLVAWLIDDSIIQVYVPDSLSASEGDTVFIDTAQLTGHIPDDGAYSTSSGAGKIALVKLLEDKNTSGGSGAHYVKGVSLLHTQGA